MTKLNTLTKWDRKLIDILVPLAEAELVHHTAFFANTFPLGFHYAWALKAKGKEIRDFLQISRWNPSIETISKAFFYDVENSPHARQGRFVPVTIFQPKYVFVQRTLATSFLARDVLNGQKCKKLTFASPSTDDNPAISLSAFLESTNDFDTVEIYAEIKVLGEYLEAKIAPYIKRENCRCIVYHADDGDRLPLIENSPRGNSTLRLFIYGGSLTTYLKRKKNHYIKAALDFEKSDPDEKMLKTGIRLVGAAAEILGGPIKNYHKILYEAAKATHSAHAVRAITCPPFYSVCRAYNATAWLYQHRSTFKKPAEYAECLNEHHTNIPRTGR